MTSLSLSNSDVRDRRRPDWQENDRRKSRPWVMDSNDRRTGTDRRLEDEKHQ